MGIENAVDSFGRQTYGASYGGMETINNGSQMAVYLTAPTLPVEDGFEQHAPEGTLVFRSTPHSLQQVDAVHQQLEGQWHALVGNGIAVVDFGPNVSLGQEDVGVENLTPEEAQALSDEFGASFLHIYNVTPQEVASRELQNRTNDGSPYNGGDAISNANHTSFCTSGFGVEISGQPRLVTAAHCFDDGMSIRNAQCNQSCTAWFGSNNVMGTVTQSGYDNGGELDSEIFTGCDLNGVCGGDAVIWTGVIGNPQRSNVSGIGMWQTGDQVCESGAYGGEKCDFTVRNVNHCYTIGGTYLCHITTLNITNGDPTIDGDSGGPWFRFSGSDVEIVGSHTGLSQDGGTEYFTGISRTLQVFSACLITTSGCVS
jgi:hypothetical protein